jgi:sulfate transport system permease protein
VLPGFTLSLGTSLLFVCLILLLPLSALVMQLAQMSWAQYWDVSPTRRWWRPIK